MHALTKTVLIAALALLALSASPAYACGCGIYIPRKGDASVSQERALVRWDGQRKDIVLSLGVLGGSQQAAIILPVNSALPPSPPANFSLPNSPTPSSPARSTAIFSSTPPLPTKPTAKSSSAVSNATSAASSFSPFVPLSLSASLALSC